MPTDNDPIAEYLDCLHDLPRTLEESYEKLVRLGPLPIDGYYITALILRTVKTYYEGQNQTINFLNKRQRGATADFFVETFLFYLKAFIQTHNLPVVVLSEANIKRQRGSLRPDISVWQGDELVATIECKTNLGFNRHGWEEQFSERESRIHRDYFPNARCFLVVLTAVNWPGFKESPKIGDQYFTLSKAWPPHIDLDHIEDYIANPIEPLFGQIETLVRLAPNQGFLR